MKVKTIIISILLMLICSLFFVGCNTTSDGVPSQYQGTYADAQYGTVYVNNAGARIGNSSGSYVLFVAVRRSTGAAWQRGVLVDTNGAYKDFDYSSDKTFTFSHSSGVDFNDVGGGAYFTGNFGSYGTSHTAIYVNYVDEYGAAKKQAFIKS